MKTRDRGIPVLERLYHRPEQNSQWLEIVVLKQEQFSSQGTFDNAWTVLAVTTGGGVLLTSSE